MDSEAIGVENLKETGRLDVKEGRNILQREVLKLYGLEGAATLAWLKKNGQRISDIIDHDELIKAEARAGNILFAASKVKDKLDEPAEAGYEK